MINAEQKKTLYDMLYISACAVNGITPSEERMKQMDTDSLFSVCRFHSLTALVGLTLEKACVKLPEKWIEENARAIRKVLLLDAERQEILNFMEKSGIWYMPLKGVILKKLYPKIGMRQMSDNDILYDKTFQKQLKEFMLSRGYKAESVGVGHHDEYQKPPVYNFEMHTILYGQELEDNKIYSYYLNVKDRLIKDEGREYGYHFTDEDFYIYMVVHENKHFRLGGTGLRSLLDCYVYTSALGNILNWEYIENELEKIGLSDFAEKSRNLSMKIFSSDKLPELSADELELLDYYLTSGTYGTGEKYAENKIKRYTEKTGSTSKFRYIMRRIFPEMKIYQMYFPFFYKHKILLPVGWLYRILRGVFCRRQKLKAEVKVIARK